MIEEGVSDLDNVIVHQGSDYIISRATFPSYFLKDDGVINYCHTAVDLQLFRSFIGPSLGITTVLLAPNLSVMSPAFIISKCRIG